jgi:hypothetical protein
MNDMIFDLDGDFCFSTMNIMAGCAELTFTLDADWEDRYVCFFEGQKIGLEM